MSSGVKVSDEVKSTYQSVVMTQAKKVKLKYCICKFSDDAKTIIVDSYGTQEEACGKDHYDRLIETLPSDDVRYVAYDFEFINKDGTRKCEMLLISWHPDDCSVRKKMICASSFNALKAALSVSKNILEGDTYADVDSKAVLDKLGGKALPS